MDLMTYGVKSIIWREPETTLYSSAKEGKSMDWLGYTVFARALLPAPGPCVYGAGAYLSTISARNEATFAMMVSMSA